MTFGFLQGSVFPKPLIIPLGPFQTFSKIRRDIRSSRCTTGVVDTGGEWEKFSIRKIFNISYGHLWVVELTHSYIFFFKFILSCQQFDNCSHCLPLMSFTLVANLPPVSTTLAKLVENLPPVLLIPVVHHWSQQLNGKRWQMGKKSTNSKFKLILPRSLLKCVWKQSKTPLFPL